ncbi:FMN-binding negative transcriptional regulator [Chelativorans oligotrophicus]|jgi:transcriptional regulator|uniref:Transcriptional regulator-like protein n=1 Tax=Chelativorans sp. (strain BNC1) TaxID=266779 RepID=Q11DJ8_CHESB|nr:FMN-binding negative transcriptional regulator [Chelativorans oligotrophicus]
MSGLFDNWSDRDISDVIDAYPMASIVPHADPLSTIEMPVVLDRDDEGKPVSLTGHLPRRAPIIGLLATNPRCTFLFRGPDSYISPLAAGRSDWAPTWNFIAVRIAANIGPDDTLTDEALDRIVAHMERGRSAPWNRESLGARYETLRRGVIGFRAPVATIVARFKLGQDEQQATFDHILESLGDTALTSWMKRMSGKKPE